MSDFYGQHHIMHANHISILLSDLWQASCSPMLLTQPFIYVRYAFTLEETGRFKDAEGAAYQSLTMSPQSAWATHALAHVFQEDKYARDGIDFMTSTRNNWEKSALSCHINWHLCLYYLG